MANAPIYISKKTSHKYEALVWSVEHTPLRSMVRARKPSSDKLEVSLEVLGKGHLAATDLIVHIMNRHASIKDVIKELASTLELCLSCDGKLSWEAEQDASALCKTIDKRLA